MLGSLTPQTAKEICLFKLSHIQGRREFLFAFSDWLNFLEFLRFYLTVKNLNLATKNLKIFITKFP